MRRFQTLLGRALRRSAGLSSSTNMMFCMLLAKDRREVEIVQQDASQRYERFSQDFPALGSRLPQYHIASHLGITPTQLSRIRKNW